MAWHARHLQRLPTGDLEGGQTRDMATIRDIAKRAHVSTATVSRALNNHPRVSDQTRKAVQQVALEMGYATRNLRSVPCVSRSVLVLTRDDSETPGLNPNARPTINEFERMVWNGAHAVLEKQGIATRLQRSNISVEEAQQHASELGVSGLILLGGVRNHAFVRRLISLEIPFVVAGAHLEPLEVNCVMADVGAGIRHVLAHLAQGGRQRIGFVNGPSTTNTSAEKLDAFRLALHLHGLTFDDRHVVTSDFAAEARYHQTGQLLEQFPVADAIVFADDTIAMGGMRAIKERRRRIPADVAVTGFGDYELSRFTDPPLTTVHFDMQTMGMIAARRLCMLIREADPTPWLIRVPTTLVVRSST